MKTISTSALVAALLTSGLIACSESADRYETRTVYPANPTPGGVSYTPEYRGHEAPRDREEYVVPTPSPVYSSAPDVRPIPVPAPVVQQPAYPFDLREARDSAANLKGSMVRMFDVVRGYGPDSYQRLRADMRDMDASVDTLQFTIERRESYSQIRNALSDVQRTAAQVDDRVRSIDADRPVRYAWSQTLESLDRTARIIR